jgi:GGDEF domain-containing protein
MSTQPVTPQIAGLPPGAVIKPLAPQTQNVQGLPPGAVVRPLSAPAAPQPEVTYQQPPTVPTAPPAMIGDDGEETTPQAAVKNAAYDKLPWYTKLKLTTMPGAMDSWAKQFYNGQPDPEGDAAAYGQVIKPTLWEMSQGIGDVADGNIAQGGHRIIKSGALMTLPLVAKTLPVSAVMSPLETASAIGGGYLGGKAAEKTTQLLGGNEAQQQFASDLGNIGGGMAAAKGIPGLMSKVSPDIAAKASAVGSLAKDDLISHIPMVGRLVRRPSFADYAEAAKTTADPQLDLFNNTPKLGNSPLFSTNPDAAAPVKFNGEQPPQSPLKQLASGPIVTPPPADTSGSVPYTPPPVAATTRAQRLGLILPEKASGAIQLGPGEILPPDSPEGLLPAAPRFTLDKDGNPRVQFLTSPATDQVAPTATNSAQSLFQGVPAQKPSLLDGIREHEFLAKTQNELEGQAGDEEGQAKLQGWMEAHNQQAPGAKTPGLMNAQAGKTLNSAIEQANASGQAVLPPEEPQTSPGIMARAKGRKGGPPSPAQATPAAQPMQPQAPVPQPQIATEANMEDLLRQSLQAKGVNPDAPKGPGLMQNVAQKAPDQRIQYPDLRAELEKMPPEDKQRAVFMSPQTELPNRRAFDIAQTNSQAPSVTMTDADGLKAFNDKFGHEAGNALLKAKGDALKKAGIEVYHFGGDEFGARNASDQQLENARDTLRNTTIRVTDADGQTHDYAGADFSYGSAGDLTTAEQNMYKMKAARKAAGNAPERGEFGNIKEVGKK